MTTNVPEFKPNSTGFNVKTNPFVPTKAMNTGASTFVPPQVIPAKPVEPPKDKSVLLLERIVKGSDTDVKSDTITEEDTAKINKMKQSLEEAKKGKDSKLSVQLLKSFCDVIKSVPKLPQNLVKMSVHQRLISRGDDGELQPLLDKGSKPGRNFEKGGGGPRPTRGGYNNQYRQGAPRNPRDNNNF